VGFFAFFVSQLMLVMMPPQAVNMLIFSVILEAVAASLVSPMTESLLALSMESAERARVSAMVYVALIVLISPFGWIAGQLSAIDRSLPFGLNMVLFAIGIILIWVISRPGFLPTASESAQPEGEQAALPAQS
jgi:MFS family permease